MKEIPLAHGKGVAFVDDDDYSLLCELPWHLQTKKYASTGVVDEDGKKYEFLMHRMILNPPGDLQIDHINGNGLDNRRSNLRCVNHSQNRMNVGTRSNNTTGFKGVCFNKHARKYMAEVKAYGVRHYLGLFDTAEAAYEAYCKAAREIHGEFVNIGG